MQASTSVKGSKSKRTASKKVAATSGKAPARTDEEAVDLEGPRAILNSAIADLDKERERGDFDDSDSV